MTTKKRMNMRILLVGMGILLGFILLVLRLWWVQVVDASWIRGEGEAQWNRNTTLLPKRGSILDRNGEVLAFEGRAYLVEAQVRPKILANGKNDTDDYVKDPVMTAMKLSTVINEPQSKILERLTKNPNAIWVNLGPEAAKITLEQKDKILAMQYPLDEKGVKSKQNQLPGIKISETTNRFYPKGKFAAHVLGFLNAEGTPVMGIERQFKVELKGEEGTLKMVKDALGYQLPDGKTEFKAAKDGQNIKLTLDDQIQTYVEEALDKTDAAFHPKAMSVIVSDPTTGEILAMANRPQHDPNNYRTIVNYMNFGVSYTFEPGSTFKIVTLAASIQEGVFNSNWTFKSGHYKAWKTGAPIKDHNGVGWGTIDYITGVQRSSNVLFAMLGNEKLGQVKLEHYFKAFGFGNQTKIQLPGEEQGNLTNVEKINKFSPRDLAVTPIGQGVTVTPIQQVMAVAAIANGGKLMQPLIVKERIDPRTGQVIERYQPKEVGRPISEATARETRKILQTVVDGDVNSGATGRNFKLQNFSVAGKTGTAQKYNERGKIIDNKYIYSFIGFAPVENPRLVVYVVVDDPGGGASYSTASRDVVAPMFQAIMEKSLQYLQEKPDRSALAAQATVVEEKQLQESTVPQLTGIPLKEAKERAKQAGFREVDVVGEGTNVINQIPAPYEKVGSTTTILLASDGKASMKMPNFKGKSLREVLEYGNLLNIAVSATGSGYVVEQNVEAGTILTGKETIQVKLSPTYVSVDK
ncbi:MULTISPECIES: PASTA domain-containing penicillin-binding protein [Brevibacillus]|uniref:PASTA domain-containing penicillin-binding protein n=1 Tax=Brevibacillus TaxID=55080 RepID=UPI000E2FC6E4|nr:MULTISPECIES: PASTA domain-containing penicillin-binding protein [Brevibacillus]MCG7316738.1 PASTA domain-containing protein [Brevibacillus laterosporus]RFB38119.1 PASTA domain-containing protein [Brevibacillus sp. VP]